MPAEEKPSRLAVYGSLAPGRKNHKVLAGLEGSWSKGTVTGHLFSEGWGASEGYPAMLYDPNGTEIPVQVFDSADLAAAWKRIDEFEGADYRRVIVPVLMESGETLRCYIYELNRNFVKAQQPRTH
jgi:gamma-glutamylcyclotransferase (GGCT)/AIG2-like uncharacterized protein YtfP